MRATSISAVAAYAATLSPDEPLVILRAAKILGISMPTIAKAADQLRAEGKIANPHHPSGRPGPPVGPCHDCNTEGGALRHGRDQPDRRALFRWGLPAAMACRRCWTHRDNHDGRPWTPRVKADVPASLDPVSRRARLAAGSLAKAAATDADMLAVASAFPDGTQLITSSLARSISRSPSTAAASIARLRAAGLWRWTTGTGYANRPIQQFVVKSPKLAVNWRVSTPKPGSVDFSRCVALHGPSCLSRPTDAETARVAREYCERLARIRRAAEERARA